MPSTPQIFKPADVLLVRLAAITIAVAVMLLVYIGLAYTPLEGTAVNAMAAQPIPFSHKHHVGDVGLDCRLCHVTVEHAASPGMPSAHVCLTCHSQLFADQQILAPLRQAAASGQPIAWAHVNRLPDFVYFDHSVHIAKDVACVECHGRLDQMPLLRKPQAMTMKWCIACHENPLSHLHQADQVFAMPPSPNAAAQVAGARMASLEPRRRLTDCSTCHR